MQLDELSTQYCRWLTATQDLSEHTVRAYESDVLALHRFLEATSFTAMLTPTVFYAFLEHLTESGHSSATVRRRLSGLRSFCGWLVAENHIEADPLADLAVRFSRPRRLPRAVSTSDLRSLLRHLSAEAELASGVEGLRTGASRMTQTATLLAVLVMVGTGIRVGELCETRIGQVDLPSRTIRVLGKGLRERMVYLSNAAIVSLLGGYIESREPSAEASSPLLINRSGNPLTPSALRTRLERAGAAAGMTSRLTPHMLRHTAATQLIEAGVDIRFVQRLLGHASLTTTEIYTHVADRSLRHAVTEADVLGSFLTLR